MLSTVSKHAAVAVLIGATAWCSASAASECARYSVHRMDPQFSGVCEAAVRALNKRCADDRFGCELPEAMANAGFTRPKWTPIDLPSNLALLEKLVRGVRAAQLGGEGGPEAGDAPWAAVRNTISGSPGRPCLGVADLDVLGDGRPVKFYRLHYDDCSLPGRHMQQSELYPAEAARYFDSLVSPNGERAPLPFPGLLASKIYDALLYRGRMYFTVATPSGDEWALERPYESDDDHRFVISPICNIKRAESPRERAP